MYAMLKEISSKSVNIISIEDPVKMKIDGIHQVEVDPDRGLTYKNAIKHTLFQDPNIICVDHLIDDEVARDIIEEYFGMKADKVIENNTINTYKQTIQ